jgi:hypothetical protein
MFTQYYCVEEEYRTVPVSANFMLTRRIKPFSINWAEDKVLQVNNVLIYSKHHLD